MALREQVVGDGEKVHHFWWQVAFRVTWHVHKLDWI